MTNESSEPGRLLSGRYRLTELIGEGGMGRVWEGVDELLDRPVAIKELIIPPQLPEAEVEVARTRMLREARHAAQLSHPSIITVFDVVEIDERPWIVMELVRGPSLGDLVKRDGAFAPERAARIGVQLASALAVAHERGIVHRDIKPANVLLARGDRAVLTDFGIAHLEGSSHLTSTGLLVGSPSYLAPEQAHGKAATPATDMWSLGVTLYQAVEGVTPFHRDTPMATLTAIVTAEVPRPQSAGALAPVLERLLHKDADLRPPVDEVARMLQEAADRGSDARGAHATTSAEPVRDASGAGRAPESAAASGPAGGAASDPAGGRGRGAPLAVLGGLAALAAVFALVLWLGTRSGAPEEAGPAGESLSPEDEQPSASSPQPSAGQDQGGGQQGGGGGDGGEDEPDLPDMDEYEDDTGFSVDVPEGWSYDRREGTSVFFDIPSGGYLQIDQTDDPPGHAETDWRNQEPALSQNFPGYELVGIEALDEDYADDYVSAADWEFTFDGSDGRMHAVNRAFHTEDKGYALFLVSTAEEFPRNRAILDEMTGSFGPAD